MLNDHEILSRVGCNLQRIRTDKGWSVQLLSVLSGVDERLIKEIESGRLNFQLTTIFTLAATLEVDFRRIIVDNIDQ
jgi:transcriptional regulator with XRE-family HTH domain